MIFLFKILLFIVNCILVFPVLVLGLLMAIHGHGLLGGISLAPVLMLVGESLLYCSAGQKK